MSIQPMASDADAVLATLKDFQRRTVEYVHHRLWDDAGARRFLVADEVGLGKTLVARGVIAKAVEHLTNAGKSRVDVVYICSNAQIAKQNLNRINVVGGRNVEYSDRLTMLPIGLRNLEQQRHEHRRVNFISFTPGTSFNVTSSGGKAPERALLYWLLAECWGRDALSSVGWRRFFAGGMSNENFKWQVDSFNETFDDSFVSAFAATLRDAKADDGSALAEALRDCAMDFRYMRGGATVPSQVSRRRYRLIGQLRKLVARSAVDALSPDLVILDEFQRFKDLLSDENPEADLAQALFAQQSARVLLLSATPYKMYTLPDEPNGEDHYQDFVATYRFLGGAEAATRLEQDLQLVRDALIDLKPRSEGEAARKRAEAQLRMVMCRTERTDSLHGEDGMVEEKQFGALELGTLDLRSWLSTSAIASELGGGDMLEYWRSSPYLLNLMESKGYKVKQKLADRAGKSDARLTQLIKDDPGLLRRHEVHRYRQLDYGNAKMRALVADIINRETWRLPWVPPSLPYWTLAGPYADEAVAGFTKRLIFSSWAVVPKAIGIVLSYEAERRLRNAASQWQRGYDDRRQTALLNFATSEGRRVGMPVLGLLYPSPTLALAGDPLRVAPREGLRLPLDRGTLVTEVRRHIEELLNRIPDNLNLTMSAGADQRWYWAAPLLLDAGYDSQEEFLSGWRPGSDSDEGDSKISFDAHVQSAISINPPLGRRPDDLADVLTELALAGPGTSALRAISRVCGGEDALDSAHCRQQASFIAWGLRTLFNRPEVITMLRSDDAGDVYWRTVLGACLDGCLSSVLDEYVHVLVESEGLQTKTMPERAEQLAVAVQTALSLRGANNVVEEVRAVGDSVQIEPYRMRVHMALRFGRDESEDSAIRRETSLRASFNSPFWPFVLATTSVGQEGLDFHTYSSAVVHWNLPSNPVDLEQREGRVHRYKGHAVRRNVAAAYRDQLSFETDDVWAELFAIAEHARPSESSDLVPYWVFAPEGGAKIERYIPAMPLSKETARRRRLLRTTGAYRLVLGQPRQDDLLAYVNDVDAAAWARIDLRPR